MKEKHRRNLIYAFQGRGQFWKYVSFLKICFCWETSMSKKITHCKNEQVYFGGILLGLGVRQ